MPTPEDIHITAGVGGGTLFPHSLRVVKLLTSEIATHGYNIDVIACGGAMTPNHFQQFKAAGAKAIQYWSAIVYNGPLAGAYLLH